jgi:hypothetical protein
VQSWLEEKEVYELGVGGLIILSTILLLVCCSCSSYKKVRARQLALHASFRLEKRVAAVNLLTGCLHNFKLGKLVKQVLSILGKPGMTRADDFMPKNLAVLCLLLRLSPDTTRINSIDTNTVFVTSHRLPFLIAHIYREHRAYHRPPVCALVQTIYLVAILDLPGARRRNCNHGCGDRVL